MKEKLGEYETLLDSLTRTEEECQMYQSRKTYIACTLMEFFLNMNFVGILQIQKQQETYTKEKCKHWNESEKNYLHIQNKVQDTELQVTVRENIKISALF